jgi:hypothetical protein
VLLCLCRSPTRNDQLHYKELEFWAEPGESTIDGELIDALLGLNMNLGQLDAAAGLLRYASSQRIPVRDWWLENMHEWDAALRLYEGRAQVRPLLSYFSCFSLQS